MHYGVLSEFRSIRIDGLCKCLPNPNVSLVHSKTGILCLYTSLFFTLTSATLCHRWRLPVFDLISHLVGARARSDAVIAAFTLRSTPTTRDLDAKTQPTGERFGLAKQKVLIHVRRTQHTSEKHIKNTSLLQTIGGITTRMWCIRTMQGDYMEVIGRTTQEIKSSDCRGFAIEGYVRTVQ